MSRPGASEMVFCVIFAKLISLPDVTKGEGEVSGQEIWNYLGKSAQDVSPLNCVGRTSLYISVQ